MQVRVVTDYSAFTALRPAWEALHAQCAPGDLFLSHDWLDAAWQWARERASLYVVCCERADGTLAGALALARRTIGRAPLARHALEFLAVPDTQRCDLIARPGERDAVIAAIARELVRRADEWQVARLGYLDRASGVLSGLVPALARARLACDAREVASNPWIALDGDWRHYLASRSRRLRKAINLAANRLAKAGRVDVEWLAPGAGDARDVERALDTITGISSRSWKTRTGNSLDNAGPQAFIRRIAHHAHRRGWLSVWTLALDGTPIAMEFQLACGSSVHALRSDFDASADELSPGSHLVRCLLESLFGAGYARYFMGPGDNAYKLRWADGTDPVHALSAYAPSLRGRSLAAWELKLKPAARRVRDAMRGGADPTLAVTGTGSMKEASR